METSTISLFRSGFKMSLIDILIKRIFIVTGFILLLPQTGLAARFLKTIFRF